MITRLISVIKDQNREDGGWEWYLVVDQKHIIRKYKLGIYQAYLLGQEHPPLIWLLNTSP